MLSKKIKKCNKCGRIKSAIEFYTRKDRPNGLSSWCKLCHCAFHKLRRKTHPELTEIQKKQHKQWLKTHKLQVNITSKKYYKTWSQTQSAKHAALKSRLKLRYGLTTQEFDALVTQQKNICPVCKQLMNPACVDHNHITGRVRGLLCRQCNLAIGLLNDNIATITRAVNYLRG